jgi:PKHD-type hydroxylase
MLIIDNLLSSDEVDSFRQTLATLPWQDGTKTAMGMASTVKRNTQADSNDATLRQLANRLLARLGETKELVSAALPLHIFPPCFNRYQQQDEYGWHVDAAIMRFPHNNQVMRSDLSMTVFLSEPEEYVGGELVINTEFGEQRLKLPAGHAVLYPSSSVHKVCAVTQGTRFAAITWLQSMIADHSLRQSLQQLDSTIQSLMENQTANRQELDQLHNVYHNLVRQFSQL